MVSVSLVLIRTAVAPSVTESFAAIISNHVISIFGGVTELVSELRFKATVSYQVFMS